MMLRLAAFSAAATALLLATAAHAACPPLSVSLKIIPAASKVIAPGKYVTLRATVTNQGSSSLSSVGLGLYVPNGLCRVKASTNARVGGNNVYWDGLTLGPHKHRTFELKAQAATNLTAGTTLAVGAAGFVAGNDCGVPAAQGVYTLTVRAAGWGKKRPRLSPHAECGVNPSVDPTVPYSLYALNQKCAEAKLVTVGAGRRLGEAEAAGRRLVAAVVITPEQCWQACSANGYPSGSYFYVFQPGSGASDECYCCPTCTAIYAPGAKVYKMNEVAEQYKECGSGIGCGIEATNPCPPVRHYQECIQACKNKDPSYVYAAWLVSEGNVCYCQTLAGCPYQSTNPQMTLYTWSDGLVCPQVFGPNPNRQLGPTNCNDT